MQHELESSAAALRLGRSRESVVRLIQRGELKGRRHGRSWMVDAIDLERLVRAQRRAASQANRVSL